MAIGDTWETINTYAFTDGTTIITADYENDVVNDLQYLYTHPSSAINLWTANTDTGVTLSATTNDILTGLTLTLTPIKSKVMLIIHTRAQEGWVSTGVVDLGYKVGTGAITYISQRTVNATEEIWGSVLFVAVTVTPAVSNTITFYAKNTSTATTLFFQRVLAIEMAN